MKSKSVGLGLMVLSFPLMVAYVIAIIYFGQMILEITAIVAVAGIFGLFTWIGYTMFTEPPAPRPSEPNELDDLGAETIEPAAANGSSKRRILGNSKFSIIVNSEIGEGTTIRDHVNLYKCKIGKNCKIESFVYIEEAVVIGNSCKIKPNVYIPTGVAIEDDVFIGPNVTFTNDKFPRVSGDWELKKTSVGRWSSIGAHSVILPGVRIGENVVVGAGSVVTKDVRDGDVVCGNPARPLVRKVMVK